MRPSEVFLRLASALVGWMILYAYFVWLAALRNIGCGPDGDEMFRLLLGILPFAAGSALALRLTRTFDEIHAILRWLAVPLALLVPFCLLHIWSVFDAVNRQGNSICGATADPQTWETIWAPLQFLAVAFCAWMLIRTWRSLSPK